MRQENNCGQHLNVRTEAKLQSAFACYKSWKLEEKENVDMNYFMHTLYVHAHAQHLCSHIVETEG